MKGWGGGSTIQSRYESETNCTLIFFSEEKSDCTDTVPITYHLPPVVSQTALPARLHPSLSRLRLLLVWSLAQSSGQLFSTSSAVRREILTKLKDISECFLFSIPLSFWYSLVSIVSTYHIHTFHAAHQLAVARNLKLFIFAIRTERIGFAQFLHRHRVPAESSPACDCGWNAETAKQHYSAL